jgi:hypothetical protein
MPPDQTGRFVQPGQVGRHGLAGLPLGKDEVYVVRLAGDAAGALVHEQIARASGRSRPLAVRAFQHEPSGGDILHSNPGEIADNPLGVGPAARRGA